jgi:hypothetical protein
MRQTPYHNQDTKVQPRSISIAAYFNLNERDADPSPAKTSQFSKPSRATLDTPVSKNIALPTSERV